MPGNAFYLMRMNDHVVYLKKIEATLQGKGDFQGTDCHECKLGKWLYGEGRAEADAAGGKLKELFESLFAPHEKFHRESKIALEKKQSGDAQGANAASTEMHKLSATLVNTLLAMDKA